MSAAGKSPYDEWSPWQERHDHYYGVTAEEERYLHDQARDRLEDMASAPVSEVEIAAYRNRVGW